jgi:hypothetical protein
MENSIIKTRKSREVRSVKSLKTRKNISEQDIRQRAFEIYKENGFTSHNALEDWFRAEKELRECDT